MCKRVKFKDSLLWNSFIRSNAKVIRTIKRKIKELLNVEYVILLTSIIIALKTAIVIAKALGVRLVNWNNGLHQ